MTINQQDILNSILESLDRIDYIKPKEIPNIDLYMVKWRRLWKSI